MLDFPQRNGNGVMRYIRLALHLDKKFRLYPPCRLGFLVAPRTAKRINFVDEDDTRLVASGKFEQILYEPIVRRLNHDYKCPFD